VSRGAIELKRERVELATVVQSAVDIVRPSFEARHHDVVLSLAGDAHTFGDPTRLVQIVGNLLHNAAKFTPEGGRIAVELVREGALVKVRVIDAGEGIASDQIERAFEMFARIEGSRRTAKTPQHGLGIGLALGRRLAEMHGGTLTAASQGVGQGTTFTLELPAMEAEAPAQAGAPAAVDAHATSSEQLRIVVIEDSEDIADTLAAVLQGMGHEVAVAYSGLSGVALVLQRRPQVVLCDIGLPDVDGVEVCRRVRGLPLSPQPLMVALTGWGRDHDRNRTRDAGFDEHLVKPIGAKTLESVLSVVSAPAV
jgi:CheY-like chemotaxis protein